MGTLSKYFYEATRDKTCRDMLHPGYTCYEAGKIYIWQGVVGAMRHYLPGAVVIYHSLMLRRKLEFRCLIELLFCSLFWQHTHRRRCFFE